VICGHRDLSPDLNGDGTITPNEWLKDCPCFDVWEWLDSEQVINDEHLFE
ncbi:N-acetylmuramoyl-L-alanine amidase, partial [Pasteurella multocida]|nr:N-acetylmuramoyl-L-alanine amidase [Pasteurella multocida]